MDLRLRSNEASRPAPPQDRPRYFQNTLLETRCGDSCCLLDADNWSRRFDPLQIGAGLMDFLCWRTHWLHKADPVDT